MWHVNRRVPRSLLVVIFWSILTLSPLLIGAILSATSYLWSLSTDAIKAMPPLVRGGLDYAPLIISGFAYAALYVFVPNRRVAWRDALLGGFIAALLAELLKLSFGEFVARGTAGSVYGAFAALPLFLIWMYLSWYALLFGAAIAATLPRLRATRFADEMRAGNQFVTAVALLKLLLDAKRDKNPAVAPSVLARRIRTSVDETEHLLEALERMGYVRQMAATAEGRRGEQDWLMTCDESETTLKAAYEHFALDPRNTLLSSDAVGLQAVRKRWYESEWLGMPLKKALAESAKA